MRVNWKRSPRNCSLEDETVADSRRSRMKSPRQRPGISFRVDWRTRRPGDPQADRVGASRIWHYSIGRMVDACTSVGILPFYGPFGDIKDTAGCEGQFRAAFLMGCVGAWSAPGSDRHRQEGLQPAAGRGHVREEGPGGDPRRSRSPHDRRQDAEDDATWKQCKVMVELAEMLAEKDPELAQAYGL
ncbi:MAG: hypothetical protein U0R26_09110 [Solirubrobacterales bacterium]